MRPSIVIVEQNKIEQRVIEGFLQGEDFDITFVSTSYECLQLVASVKTDLIIFEATIRGLDARDVCSCTDIPIIFLSTLDIVDESRASLKQGRYRYITKPYAPSTLVDSIKQLLRCEPLDYPPLGDEAYCAV